MRPFIFAVLCLALAALALSISAPSASAEPVSALGVQVFSSGARQLPAQSNGSVEAQGGNVTEINIDALSVTKTWQGYFGNVSGNIHLDDAENQSFYVWGNGTSVSGQIYASRNSTISWTSVDCSSAQQRADEEVYLGVSPADGDSVMNTFNMTSHPSFNIGLRTIGANRCFSTYGYVNGEAQNETFPQMLLSDEYNNTIYSTLISSNSQGYNGNIVDFQLLVGESEHVGKIGPTPYYFFVELN